MIFDIRNLKMVKSGNLEIAKSWNLDFEMSKLSKMAKIIVLGSFLVENAIFGSFLALFGGQNEVQIWVPLRSAVNMG